MAPITQTKTGKDDKNQHLYNNLEPSPGNFKKFHEISKKISLSSNWMAPGKFQKFKEIFRD